MNGSDRAMSGPRPEEVGYLFCPFCVPSTQNTAQEPPDKESRDTWNRPALDLLPEIEILADLRPMNIKINVYCGKPLTF